jgi:para-nitrobenzyl esterase
LENFINAVKRLYGENAEQILKVYPASNEEKAKQAATDLAGDRFIGLSTWRWFNMQCKTGGKPVYRYLYSHPRPALRSEINATNIDPKVSPSGTHGAVHSAEIEYAMGNLPTNRVYNWQPEDYKVSEIMQSFFANFIKTGNPNGFGIPEWPSANESKPVCIMNIDVNSIAIPESDTLHQRYLLLDQISGE